MAFEMTEGLNAFIADVVNLERNAGRRSRKAGKPSARPPKRIWGGGSTSYDMATDAIVLDNTKLTGGKLPEGDLPKR